MRYENVIKSSQRCRGITLESKECRKYTNSSDGYCSSHQYQARIKESNLQESMCAICLEKVEKYDVLECGHLIHRNCIRQTTKMECPVCRTELLSLPAHIRRRIQRNAERASDEEEENNIMSWVFDIVRRAFAHQPEPTRIDGMVAYYDESTSSVLVYFTNDEEEN